MKNAGLKIDEALVRHGAAFTAPEGEKLCRQVMAVKRSRPTAIVAGNDLMALGCYDVYAALGLRCPDDISVVGFNDMPFSDRFSPPLTTIRVPQYDMGEAAAEMLLSRLQQPSLGTRHRKLGVELVVRASTAAPAT
jgi:LacI family transcriptional regulator